MHAGSPVRPLPASMFSHVRQEAASTIQPFATEIENSSAPPSPTHSHSPIGKVEASLVFLPKGSQLHSPASSAAPAPPYGESEIQFQPLLPRQPEVLPVKEVLLPASPQRRAAAQTAPAKAMANTTMLPPASAEPYVPLLPDSPPLPIGPYPSSDIDASAPRSFLAGTPSPAKGQTELRSRPDDRPPDEIQIHIGRIEVTAVQQAPPRSQSKSRRDGPSLSEYLQRRNRGA